MQELNPYESSEQSDKSKRVLVCVKRKKGLGLYDLAALVLVVAALILLLATAVSNKGVPFGGIILSSGGFLQSEHSLLGSPSSFGDDEKSLCQIAMLVYYHSFRIDRMASSLLQAIASRLSVLAC